jgi:hypothetical protein
MLPSLVANPPGYFCGRGGDRRDHLTTADIAADAPAQLRRGIH